MATERDEDDEEGGGSAQPDLIQSYLSFAARAIRSRIPLVLGTIAVVSLLTVAAAAVWPRTYSSLTQIMVQSQNIPGVQKDDPFTGADRVIMRRENIEALVKQTELTKHWQRGRSPALLLKDRLMELIRGPIPESALAPVLVSTLESRIYPDASDRTLTITVDWSDPELAAKIAETAMKRFVDFRQTAEIASRQKEIDLLEAHAADTRKRLKERADELKKRREERLANREPDPVPVPGEAPKPKVVRTRPQRDLAAEGELATLRADLTARRGQQMERERQDQSQVNELRSKLDETLRVVTRSHPDAVIAQRRLDAAMAAAAANKSQGTQDLADLERRVKEAEGRVVAGGGSIAVIGDSGSATPSVPPEIRRLIEDSSEEGVDPTLISEVEHQAAKLTDLRDQIDKESLNLQRAQQAFETRYQVVIPAEIPGKPKKPNVRMIIAGGVIGSIVLGLVLAILAQLRKGKIVAKWQVYNLGVPVLAEIKFPRGPNA
ncbi:MAG TPA: hypothetical protein VFQ61_27630 [Polyangiaceae bacterium]|nr:hypothetical protein [Polyangiaceae bacterium]